MPHVRAGVSGIAIQELKKELGSSKSPHHGCGSLLPDAVHLAPHDESIVWIAFDDLNEVVTPETFLTFPQTGVAVIDVPEFNLGAAMFAFHLYHHLGMALRTNEKSS